MPKFKDNSLNKKLKEEWLDFKKRNKSSRTVLKKERVLEKKILRFESEMREMVELDYT